jgi:hypothetical protein
LVISSKQSNEQALSELKAEMNALLQQRERGTAREREIVVVAYRNAEKMLVRVKAKTSALNKQTNCCCKSYCRSC